MKIVDLNENDVFQIDEGVFGDLAKRVVNKTKDVANGVGLAVRGQGANEFAKLTNLIDQKAVQMFNTARPGEADATGKDLPLGDIVKMVGKAIMQATNNAVGTKQLLIYIKENKREIIKNVNVADRGAAGADQMIQLMLQGGSATAPEGFGVAECVRSISLIFAVTFLHMQVEMGQPGQGQQAGQAPTQTASEAEKAMDENPEYQTELKTFEQLTTKLAGELYTPGNAFLANIQANNEFPAKQEAFIVAYATAVKAKYFNADLKTLETAANSTTPESVIDDNQWRASFFGHISPQVAQQVQQNADVTSAIETFKNDLDAITTSFTKLAFIEKTANEVANVDATMKKLIDWVEKAISLIKTLQLGKGGGGATSATTPQAGQTDDEEVSSTTQGGKIDDPNMPNWEKVKMGYDALDAQGQEALVKALFNK